MQSPTTVQVQRRMEQYLRHALPVLRSATMSDYGYVVPDHESPLQKEDCERNFAELPVSHSCDRAPGGNTTMVATPALVFDTVSPGIVFKRGGRYVSAVGRIGAGLCQGMQHIFPSGKHIWYAQRGRCDHTDVFLGFCTPVNSNQSDALSTLAQQELHPPTQQGGEDGDAAPYSFCFINPHTGQLACNAPGGLVVCSEDMPGVPMWILQMVCDLDKGEVEFVMCGVSLAVCKVGVQAARRMVPAFTNLQDGHEFCVLSHVWLHPASAHRD
eukprot:TRINITY_DN93213_c0_g1_i1.p2 TRINITY_DN93213_c0_g1~~TRINITY_DN93213_c0_g1_i1.p2  ORF type:complete len:270 (-),score=36.79 TRINITY_DN93213_c0_g1_i1:59-868(-)